MEKIQPRSLYLEVADRIRDLIERGTLLPGEKIAEKQLCESFGVSRTPLREALKVLTSEGLVENLPNRGSRVVRLTRTGVQNTYDVMGALEGLSGELACPNITDAELARVRKLHQRMLEFYRRKEIKPYFEINQQIHEAILAASHNDVLIEMYNNLSQRVKRVRYSVEMGEDNWTQAVSDHEAMLEALEARDGPRLGAILRQHLRHKLEVAEVSGIIDA
ncbi:GntR family transcriptional regulator [Halomonas binhaiensis]|uniref:GntR family transcriptional regulator n=1 Tax=Halomonas binhaiensis TaxID=2562282 RepID=A0A5C1NJN9_9GAMM|nr:GntR family transcriptional regulator [Halomonas binhaiensis]QEM82853.1 GntR family transcriptional regulator [Halomonas binhaiensis]